MHDSLHIIDVSVRLARHGTAGSHHYRPLVIGPAWLERPAETGPWTVRLAACGWLRPAPVPHGPGLQAWAILCPEDLSPAGVAGPRLHCGSQAEGWSQPDHIEIVGWCLMYDPTAPGAGPTALPGGSARVAVVDASDGNPRMPAVFELPGELFERLEYLAARGIPARPLALPTACRR